MGLFNNGTSRYIKNRAPVLRIQKDLFFFLSSLLPPAPQERSLFFSISFYITKRRKENLHKTDAGVFKKADARFRKEVPPGSLPPSEGHRAMGGVGVPAFNRGWAFFHLKT